MEDFKTNIWLLQQPNPLTEDAHFYYEHMTQRGFTNGRKANDSSFVV